MGSREQIDMPTWCKTQKHYQPKILNLLTALCACGGGQRGRRIDWLTWLCPAWGTSGETFVLNRICFVEHDEDGKDPEGADIRIRNLKEFHCFVYFSFFN